jgi:crotonobetainyl-CoA:carnitine CoA-transferase CaiB-like acyl-CoA transferase
MADGPLADVRVLDLTAVVSGPFCTMMLGDLGADVIKIEPPEGEPMRNVGRPIKNGVSAPFLNFNRNKRSVVVDMKKERACDVIRRLGARAHVMVENFRPGVADRLGVGYGDMRRVNPKIIYCSISGFGAKGRLANAPAYDPVIQGYSGMAYVQAGKDGQPATVRMALADKVAGLTAALSIVSALHAARNRGVGQYIRVPMLGAMIAFAANDTFYGYTFLPENEFKDKVPRTAGLDPFQTKDGWIMLAPFTDAQYERLCKAVEHPEWWTDGAADRLERVRAVLRNLGHLLKEHESSHWLALLNEADVPCGPVHSYDTLLTDEEIVSNENFLCYEYPQVGAVRTVNPAPRFSETPMKLWRLPPALGEHTGEVLRELGFDSAELAELRAAKVIN